MTTTLPLPTSTPAPAPRRARRLGRSLVVLLVFFAIGTFGVSRIVTLDPIESAVNGLVWCPDDDASMKVHSTGSGSAQRSNGDSLVCRTDGQVVREVDVPQVMLTNVAVSAGATLVLMAVGIGSLIAIAKLRRGRVTLGGHA